MAQLVLQPRGSARFRGPQNYQHSIRNGINLSGLSSLASTDRQALEEIYPSGVARLWGSTPTQQRNNDKAKALAGRRVGDHVLFYADSGFFARARIAYLFRDRAVALATWGTDDEQQTWEHMMALDDIEEFGRPVPAKPVLTAMGMGFPLRSLTLVDAGAYAAVASMLPALVIRSDGAVASSGLAVPPRSARGAGYLADAALRRAIEQYAVAKATAHYQSRGWEVTDVGAIRPFDLVVTSRHGLPDRHVEVKGSSQDTAEVELTSGEVDHSRDTVPCDLFVVSKIQYAPDGAGGYQVSGGAGRIWRDWQAEEDDLRATRFRYTLPSGAEAV